MSERREREFLVLFTSSDDYPLDKKKINSIANTGWVEFSLHQDRDLLDIGRKAVLPLYEYGPQQYSDNDWFENLRSELAARRVDDVEQSWKVWK